MRLRSFHSILDECLAAIQQGEALDSCLLRYPREADRLRPLLTLAERVRKTPPTLPRPWPQARAWQRVRQRAADLRSPRRGVHLSVNYGAWLRPVAVTLAVLLALFSAAGGTALAAQNSLPDSPLYRVKLATEEVRLLLVFDDVHRAEILMDQSDERMDEILTMTRQDKTIPGNVLSALRSRNERAADILAEHPEQADVSRTLAAQAETQESNLVFLFPEISQSAHKEYTEAVAAVHNARLQDSQSAVGLQPEELSEGVQHITGLAEQVSNDIWTVGGLEVHVDATTIGQPDLQSGASVRFVVGKNSRGQLRALTVSTIPADLPPSGSVVSGEVEQITDQGIVIAGQLFPITSNTFRTGKLKKGQKVEVKLGKSETGVVASTVRPLPTPGPAQGAPAPFTFEGSIEGNVSRANDEWKIGGVKFFITANTTVDAQAGPAKDGARVLVEASMQDDELFANDITVLASDSAPDSAYLVGIFQESDEGIWRVSGLEVVPPVRTAEPEEGSLLSLELRRRGNDLEVQSSTVIQTPDETGLVRVDVIISKIEGAFWTVDFGTVRVASTAESSGPEPTVGARAIVWGRQNLNGVFEASYAHILDKTPVIATPTPSPSPEPMQ